jgi:hypothetical protein
MNLITTSIAVALGVVLAGLIWSNFRLVLSLALLLTIFGLVALAGVYAYDEWGIVGAAIVAKAGILGFAQMYESSRRA